MRIHTTPSVVVRVVLWLVMLLGGAWYALWFDWHEPLFRNGWFHLFSALVGLFVMTLAFRAAANGGRELSKGRVGDIPRLETNCLVTTGIYRCMRHPMLFGLTLLPLGWALLLGSPTFITVIAPLEMVFIIFMVLIFEEREVAGKFNEEYRRYREVVPAVSFRPACLKRLFAKVNRKKIQ
ncbi:MAG: isoprenylcysteine carboxylmethyltransferase family protein [Sulfurovum sp.]|nr:isoprenylcysteine carboxylmethyltransferase family protein [Sulfurovum sp.]